MATVFKRKRWVDADGKQCPKGTPGARRMVSRFYTVEWRDSNGKLRRKRGYPDKAASEQMGARLERMKGRGEEGMLDLYEEHRSRPLAEHVADYAAELKTLNRSFK